MKKFMKSILPFVLIVTLCAFVLIACSDPGAPEHKIDPVYTVTEKDTLDNLKEFMTGRENRTTFSENEKNAAEYLNAKMLGLGLDSEIHDFTVSENEVSDLQSQNVVAKLLAPNHTKNTKNVIIGAYYDNRFSSPYNGASGDRSPAALNGGTGVAAVMSVAQYLAEHRATLGLKFDVTFVFFGAGYYSAAGARAFYEKMSGADLDNTVLMVEMQRLGCDHVYAFSDARETKRETFFDGVAKASGLDVYKATQKSPLITGATSLKGVPYYQWAHNGLFGVFFNNNIPTLNLVGANWETADMSNAESKDHENISFTSKDSLDTVLKLYPDCGKKMATACTLIVNSLASADFIEVMEYDKNNFPETDILNKDWIWYLVVLGFVMIAFAVMTVASYMIGKKHPIEMPKPIKMKMAVFGMDYEDQQSDDIFIDLRDPFAPNDEIFPGIENNARSSRAKSADDVFSLQHESGDSDATQSADIDGNDKSDDDPFDTKGD